MENTFANIRILDVVRLVHGYFIFVFLIIPVGALFSVWGSICEIKQV
jgi:hypothetical protein